MRLKIIIINKILKKYKKALKRVLPKLRKIDLNNKPLLYQSGQCVTPLKTVI